MAVFPDSCWEWRRKVRKRDGIEEKKSFRESLIND